MLRYIALAAAIVLGAILVLMALPRPPSVGTHDRYTGGHGRDGPGEAVDARRSAAPIAGAAPWALSVVPECFRQKASFAGAPAFVRPHVPPRARNVASGELRTADCTLTVRDGTAILARGDDRLVVPAPARFAVAGDRLVLAQRAGRREEVRFYALASGASPSFAPLRAAASAR